ncbi:MAG: deoxyribodipyrimidine photo-lyase [Pseudomonadota bacterium]
MNQNTPTIWWVRRDLRLTDNPTLNAALDAGGSVLPVFIWDDLEESLGAAPKWRLGEALKAFGAALEAKGSRLLLRRGDALEVLREISAETGARQVFWSRLYTPDPQHRDTQIKASLKSDGIEAASYPGFLLFEPWTVKTKTGGFYKVYSPMWRAVRDLDVGTATPAPKQLPAPELWPRSASLDSFQTAIAMNRGAEIVAPYANIGEAAALDRLSVFSDSAIADYNAHRDIPSIDGTSRLSENLALGEISPRTCWHAGHRAMIAGATGAETFLKELVWREFAYHLTHHTPHILTSNWRPEWDGFSWDTDPQNPRAIAWRQGRTGVPFVDAAMREMYVTGRMHNRGRMIVASYLTKHLLCHWRIGQKWFEDCLIDWDPASNAMGWQWAAGSGPDAAPYFRVFNPETQLDKFDPKRAYVHRWIAEGQASPPKEALSYFDAIPRSWQLSATDPYPNPIVSAAEGRKRALNAYENRSF